MNCREEMMKTAGVETKPKCTKERKCEDYNCINCDKQGYKLPHCTAEKQLELIKLIMTADNIDYLEQSYNRIMKVFMLECRAFPKIVGIGELWETQNKDYDLALAELVTMLMNAGELDKEKVKRILEG